MQDHLDAQKTQKDRNVMGQFSTPFPLALDIMTYMRKLLGTDDVSFVEPSIGTGVFYSAFTEVFGNKGQQVLGFEIDPHYFNPTKDFWDGFPIELRCSMIRWRSCLNQYATSSGLPFMLSIMSSKASILRSCI